jgi:two-component system chemotaxis sensor kinase CheA
MAASESLLAADICADFLLEAREILDRLGERLVALERAPGDRESLNVVFRGFHTIKGGAGFLDFEPMVAVCHAVEDRLNAARTGAAPLDATAFDGAQQSLDLLASMVQRASAGLMPEPAPAALLAALRMSSAVSVQALKATVDEAAIAALVGGGDEDGELDFEALLDCLHGPGGIPGGMQSAADTPPPTAPEQSPTEPAETTVREDVRRLDAMVNLVGELVLARNRLKAIRPRLRDDALDRAVASLDATTARLQSAVMCARMQPVGRVFSRFPKLARDLARQLHKQVELEVVGADIELDRNLVEALADPLVHLVRNAIDHGIESPAVRLHAGKPAQGQVRLSAQQVGDHVVIEVCDDGNGIDLESIRRSACDKGLVDADAAARLSAGDCLQLIFLPGFSTRGHISDLSGRGVGLDVVQTRIRELSGAVHIHSDLGIGTRIVIRVPLTLAILPSMLVEIGDDLYALPMARVIEVLAHRRGSAEWIDGCEVLDLRQVPVPLMDLRAWLGVEGTLQPEATVVVLQSGDQRFGLAVDHVRGREEVVIKALPPTLRGLPGYAGASLVGDGRMALILDVDALLRTGLHAGAQTATCSSSNRPGYR